MVAPRYRQGNLDGSGRDAVFWFNKTFVCTHCGEHGRFVRLPIDDAIQARRPAWEDRPEARAMRQARFRLRINEEIREADIVVGTKAQWESSSLAASPGWSVNIQRGHIVGMRLVGMWLVRGQTYVPKNLDLDLGGMRLA